ncbi:MAG: threonine/serine dehydratase [Planctomycetota bacterium]|nr:threonine/serine dehydratase [Planctomycetota bacterium]
MSASPPVWQPSGDVLRAARERIKPYILITPLLRAEMLDRGGLRVLLKAESLQRTGSFKVRGAFNALMQLAPEQRAKGVITYSSGNHGQALGLAAFNLGWAERGSPYPCTVVMPEDANPLKVERTRAMGCEIVAAGHSTEERKLKAVELAERTGQAVIPSYDHPNIIAGQGTLGLEIMDQWMGLPTRTRRLRFVAGPVGGGGLMAGAASGLRVRGFPGPIYGVEPERADDTRQSLEKGERVTIPQPDTVCDGLRSVTPGALTFPILQRCEVQLRTVTEAQVKETVVMLAREMKLVVEPSGAVAVAAWLFGQLEPIAEQAAEAADVVLILSGGNIDPKLLGEWSGTG